MEILRDKQAKYHTRKLGQSNEKENRKSETEPLLRAAQKWHRKDKLYKSKKHSQHNNDEWTHFFRKNIPLTLYSKGLRKGYVWEGSWRLNKLQHIIFTNPSARVGYDTRSIFKRSLTGLNSEYSFS